MSHEVQIGTRIDVSSFICFFDDLLANGIKRMKIFTRDYI